MVVRSVDEHQMIIDGRTHISYDLIVVGRIGRMHSCRTLTVGWSVVASNTTVYGLSLCVVS